MKHHLHDEQFDGHYHAACGRTDPVSADSPKARFFNTELDAVPYGDRCRRCARIWWPKGGEPHGTREGLTP